MYYLQDCVSDIIKHARQSKVPMVIDGVCKHIIKHSLFSAHLYHFATDHLIFCSQDGLFLVTNCPDLVSGYPLAVLTPNVNEYKRLVQKVLNGEVNDQNGPQQLINLSKG